MRKTLDRHNVYQLYIREQYKPIWREFVRLAKKDPDFLVAQANVGTKGNVSIGVMTLVFRYVFKHNPDFGRE